MKITTSVILVLITFISFAENGIELIMSHKQFKDNGVSIKAEKRSIIWVTENKMKISSDDPSEPIMMYDADNQIITLIMRDKEQYGEISKVEMEEMNAQLEESRKMMEQQLAALPANQREMVEKRMGNMFSQDIIKVNYTLKAENIDIGPYSTSKYIGETSDVKVEEVYVASLDQFEVETSYFQVYSKMTEFMKENMSKMMSSISGENVSGTLSDTYPTLEKGIPVKSISFTEEFKSSEEVLEQISSKDIPSEAFSIPSGYKKLNLLKDMKSGK